MPTILVVDDDVDLLFSVKRILQKNQYEVIPLSDCTAAVAATLEQKPDLILLDINLGACDGRELCKDLKSNHHITTPILLFSANGEYAVEVDTYGANGFIQKPFDSSEFIEFIHKHASVTG